ncbi:MAG: hypothetical protein GZ085_09070 [Sulfuriferula multivorans]|uniref:Uncharacterized protein n=1 Tax=Sulfuriferula multivorans TaxID=1559896 RepID=A0A7C9NRK5_9PROT|nr:hypothetical protein [Sulfuriferula multivorans]
MFTDTACHRTAQNGQKLQHVAVKVLGLVFLVTPHSMHAMIFILTKAVKKTWQAQIGLAAGLDGRCGATWAVLFENHQYCRKPYNFGCRTHGHARTTRGIHGHYVSGVVIAFDYICLPSMIARPVNQAKEARSLERASIFRIMRVEKKLTWRKI